MKKYHVDHGPDRVATQGKAKLLHTAMHLYVRASHDVQLLRHRLRSEGAGHVRIRMEHQLAEMAQELADLEMVFAAATSASRPESTETTVRPAPNVRTEETESETRAES